jgi:acetyl esterase
MLFYPVLDHDFETTSYRAYGEKNWVVTTQDMRWYWNHYARDCAQRDDPLASPLRARTLSELPSALIVVAGLDPLAAEDQAYAARLQKDGVATTVHHYDDMVHGFLGMIGFAAVADQAAEAAARWLRTQTERQ